MDEQRSLLTRKLVLLVEQIRGTPLSHDDVGLLEGIVWEHGLGGEDPPVWMISLLDDVARQRVSESHRRVPKEYPRGFSGLVNVLLDIEADLTPLGIEDYGEGVNWPMPALGLQVVVIRESPDPGYVVEVSRLAESH